MNFYIDASYSGSAKDAIEKWVIAFGGDVKHKENDSDCKLAYFDYQRETNPTFHINIYTSSTADEQSYDLAQGRGSVWTSYLIDQGDKKPKAGNKIVRKNSKGEELV